VNEHPGEVPVTIRGTLHTDYARKKPYWEALVAGRSGVSEVTLFDTQQLGRHVAGEVKGFRARDFLSAAEARRTGRASAFAVAAARMAVEDAGLKPREIQGERTSVVVGTTMGEANVLGELLTIRGTLHTDCRSQVGSRELRENRVIELVHFAHV